MRYHAVTPVQSVAPPRRPPPLVVTPTSKSGPSGGVSGSSMCYDQTLNLRRRGSLQRMARTTLPASVEQFIKERLSLTHKEKKLADLERRIIQEMGRVLPSFGYRLVSTNGQAGKRTSGLTRKRSLGKALKCP